MPVTSGGNPPEVKSDPSAVGADLIGILDMSPPAGTVLRRGDMVTVHVTLKYELVSAESGTITFTVRDTGNPRYAVLLPMPRKTIPKGTGTATFTQSFTVPLSAAEEGLAQIGLTFVIVVPGSIDGRVVANAAYPIQ
jgi:hypothetical protein